MTDPFQVEAEPLSKQQLWLLNLSAIVPIGCSQPKHQKDLDFMVEEGLMESATNPKPRKCEYAVVYLATDKGKKRLAKETPT